MPQIIPRKGRFDISQALASGISGGLGGYRQAKQDQSAKRREEAQTARYQQAIDKANQEEVRRRSAVKAMLDAAGSKSSSAIEERKANDQDLLPEQYEAFRKKSADFMARAQQMADEGFDVKEIRSWIDVNREAFESEIFATAYKNIEAELFDMEQDDLYEWPPALIKGIRDAMNDPDEMASPKALRATIREAKAGRNAQIQLIENKSIGRSMADEWKAANVGDLSQQEYEAANQVFLEWENGGYRRHTREEMLKGMKRASRGLPPYPTSEELKQESSFGDEFIDGLLLSQPWIGALLRSGEGKQQGSIDAGIQGQ